MPSMRSVALAASLLALASFTLPPSGSAGEIDPGLRGRMAFAGEELPVIVTFAGVPDLRPYAALAKAPRRAGMVQELQKAADRGQAGVRALLQGRNKPFKPLWIVNALALQASPELIATLAARPEVVRVEPDRTTDRPEVVPAEVAPAEWNLQAVGAPPLWAQGLTGEGVTVAVLDTGVDLNHPDLRERWRGGGNSWLDPYRQTAEPYDGDPGGHGTLVTGIIVGGNAGGTAIGVAPGARWMAAKIFDDGGSATNSQILTAFQWLLDPDGNPASDDAPDVVNNSWGFEEIAGSCDSIFRTAVTNLKAAGIAVVFAAGNSGPAAGTSISPANYPESFGVGALDASLAPAIFSSRGPSACDGTFFPEVVAPGVGIRSAVPTPPFLPPMFEAVAGTSFAAPHAAGIMALLLSDNAPYPRPEGDALEATLRASANDLGPAAGPDNESGYGLVDALAAFRLLAGTLAVQQPNGGEILTSGEVYSIEWSAIPGAAGYTLQYSVNNGRRWNTIGQADAVTHLDWTIPAVRKTQEDSRVRVIARDSGGVVLGIDGSDASFTIVPSGNQQGGKH